MIILKSDREMEFLRASGKITAETMNRLSGEIKAGVKTIDLDRMAEDFILSKIISNLK